MNITATSSDAQLAFGLTGCRSAVPALPLMLMLMLEHLDTELAARDDAVGL